MYFLEKLLVLCSIIFGRLQIFSKKVTGFKWYDFWIFWEGYWRFLKRLLVKMGQLVALFLPVTFWIFFPSVCYHYEKSARIWRRKLSYYFILDANWNQALTWNTSWSMFVWCMSIVVFQHDIDLDVVYQYGVDLGLKYQHVRKFQGNKSKPY